MNAPQKKIKVLFVDDEENNLMSFKASFRFDYDILIANNADDALELVNQHNDIAVILCDQRMPGKTGVELLQSIIAIDPKPIRMLITGYTDIGSVIDSINKGHVFRYINKPWVEADVKAAIEEGYKYYQTNSILAQKNEELVSAYKELDKFAYSVTHDIKGPLISIKGAIGIVRKEPLSETAAQFMELMSKSVDKLNDFVDNIHFYYRFKRGELDISEISFADIVETLKTVHEIELLEKNIIFDVKINQKQPFLSDYTKLTLILNNLFSNAIKYQRRDEQHKKITLEINIADNKATITISDNGIGIEKEYINNIFDMFFRATSDEPGTGFGLYNVREAISMLNGSISVNSEPGKGTKFDVAIPSK